VLYGCLGTRSAWNAGEVNEKQRVAEQQPAKRQKDRRACRPGKARCRAAGGVGDRSNQEEQDERVDQGTPSAQLSGEERKHQAAKRTEQRTGSEHLQGAADREAAGAKDHNGDAAHEKATAEAKNECAAHETPERSSTNGAGRGQGRTQGVWQSA